MLHDEVGLMNTRSSTGMKRTLSRCYAIVMPARPAWAGYAKQTSRGPSAGRRFLYRWWRVMHSGRVSPGVGYIVSV